MPVLQVSFNESSKLAYLSNNCELVSGTFYSGHRLLCQHFDVPPSKQFFDVRAEALVKGSQKVFSCLDQDH